jgi:hypothetical protein
VPDEPDNEYEVVYQNLLPPWGIHFDTFSASNETDCRNQWKRKHKKYGDNYDTVRIVTITSAKIKKQLP